MILARFLFRFLRGRRIPVGLAVAMTFIQAAADVLIAFPLKIILDKIVHHRDPTMPGLGWLVTRLDHYGTRNALNLSETHTQFAVIVGASVMLVTLGLISAVMSYGQMLIAVNVAQHLGATLKQRLFDHMQRLGLPWHARNRSGDLVQRLTSNMSDLEKLVSDGLIDLLSGVLTLVGIVGVMLWLNWQFTLICMGIIPAMFAVVFGYTRRIKRATRSAARAGGQLADVAQEDLNAIVEVKAFRLEERESELFAAKVAAQRGAAFRAGRLQAEFSPLVLVLVAASNAATISVGSWVASGHGRSFGLWTMHVSEGSLTIGSLTVFLAYSKQLYQPMRDLSKLINLASMGSAAAERITAVLTAQPEQDSARGVSPVEAVTGEVRIADVTFGYVADQPVLHDVSVLVPAGRRVALVGLSGSGKTTLVSLLPRFFEPWTGTISIDGHDIRSLPIEFLRQNIGLVLQTSMLLEGTIRENIRIGRPDASDEEVRNAARKAYIADEIEALPNGYDAHVREQGLNFSAGQRQRLAIARAILLDAPILILDEPTANLDVESESRVMEAITGLVQGRTVIMITHRLSTLGSVDDVVVLKAGRVVEAGPVHELRRGHGEFARLLSEQSRYSAHYLHEDAEESAVARHQSNGISPAHASHSPSIVCPAVNGRAAGRATPTGKHERSDDHVIPTLSTRLEQP
jgi:ATP-binding cassette subfamily B protein